MSTNPSAVGRLQLLGAFRLRLDGQDDVPLRRNEQRLVALLAIKGDLCRADAAAWLWSGVEEARARANLRSALSRLRGKCNLIQQVADVMHLHPLEVDYTRLRGWAEDVLDSAPQTIVARPPEPIGVALLLSWDEEWLTQPREDLRLLVLDALEVAAARLVSLGRLPMASSLIRSAIRLDPLRESAAKVLIDIHMREGNHAAAISEYRRIQRAVFENIGTMPHPSLTSLVASLRPSSGTWMFGSSHTDAAASRHRKHNYDPTLRRP